MQFLCREANKKALHCEALFPTKQTTSFFILYS